MVQRQIDPQVAFHGQFDLKGREVLHHGGMQLPLWYDVGVVSPRRIPIRRNL